MTVTYSRKVATTGFCCFFKLLLRWNGSVYKLLWREFAWFAGAYYVLSFLYRFALVGAWKRWFVKISLYCQQFNSLIPVAFILGFYVSIIVSRWWEQFKTIPYPQRMALFVSTLLIGTDERARLMRRTIMRYLCLTHVMTFSSISPPVKKRFPSLDNMQEAGFLLSNEQKVLEDMTTPYNKYFVPLIWAASLVARARKEGKIKDDFAVKTLIDEINDFRGKCASLFGFDWVTIPLVYTQVVTLAVYMFFLSCLMGRQFLEEGEGHYGDLYFPFFTYLQFFFYMGWLKVAETLLNPFGEDDDDFDINGLIDKNLKIAYLIVDEMHADHPELLKDQYWDSLDFKVPYTEASQAFEKEDYIGSAVNIEVPEAKSQLVNAPSMPVIAEDLEEVALGKHAFTGSKRPLPSVSRQSSKLSNFFKAQSRRPSKKGDSTADLESGNASQPMTIDSFKDKASSICLTNPLAVNGSQRNISTSPADDLLFNMSDDDLFSPTVHGPQSLQPVAYLPSVQFVNELSSLIPKNKQLSMSTTPVATFHHGTPLDSSDGDYPRSMHHQISQLSVLDPLVEAPESLDAFAGMLKDQLKAVRDEEAKASNKF